MEDGSRDATSAGTVTDFLIWVHSSRLQGWDTDFIGYFASALVLAAFLMKSMTTLRVTALISNIAFIAYAISADMRPILIKRQSPRRVGTVKSHRELQFSNAAGLHRPRPADTALSVELLPAFDVARPAGADQSRAFKMSRKMIQLS